MKRRTKRAHEQASASYFMLQRSHSRLPQTHLGKKKKCNSPQTTTQPARATHHPPLQVLLLQPGQNHGNRLARVLPQELQDLRPVISVDPRDGGQLDRAQHAPVQLELVASLPRRKGTREDGEPIRLFPRRRAADSAVWVVTLFLGLRAYVFFLQAWGWLPQRFLLGLGALQCCAAWLSYTSMFPERHHLLVLL